MLYCRSSSEGIQPKVELSRFIPYIVDQNTEEGKIVAGRRRRTTVELLAFIVNETSKPLTEMVYGLNEVNRTIMLKGVTSGTP
jgi:hypothetical protein